MLIALVLAAGVYTFTNSKDPVSIPLISNNDKKEPEDKPTGVNGKYLFSGTIVLARAVERDAKGDYNRPFSKMDTFNPGAYDAWMADLECPVTTNNVSYDWQIANTAFNCRPEWLPALGKYFQLVSIAGNHTHDMGAEGFPETVEHLQKAGIQAVGNYTPRAKDDICEVTGLPVRVKKSDNSEVKGTLPVAFCAWHYFSFDPKEGEIETAKSYAKIMPVFGFMHAGAEYLATAGSGQQSIARKIIDNGAEFVIGNSPHWVQNTEVYKGKLIAYSTGNFIFDQLDYETQRGVSIGVEVEIPYDDNVAKWLELGEKCVARDDTCFEEAQKQGLSRVKLNKLKYEAIASSGGNRKITQKADATLQKAVEERLNWTATLKELGQ